MQSLIEVIINAGSGANNNCGEVKQQLIELFHAHRLDAQISIAEKGADILKLAEKAAAGDCRIVVAGGGDGTVSAVASKIAGTNKTLAVLPLGTLNNFSKDLRIPQTIAEAVRVIAENNVKQIDVGEVNGRIFVNNSSIGLYPQIVKQREEQQRLGHGKWRSAVWAALKILVRSPFLAVKLESEINVRIVKTPFVFVGNNEYKMDFFNIGRRSSLDDGRLSVYFLHRSGRKGLFLLALRTLFGRLRQTKDFEDISIGEITFETKKKQILVAFDGEIEMLNTPLRYKIHPQALRVIVPEENDKL